MSRSSNKAWTRRLTPDRSQGLRHGMQAVFLLLNLWIGAQFYLFVRFFESGGAGGWHPGRPAGVEGWLPIAGMMNASYFLQTGQMPAVHPAAMVLFVTFVAISFLFRKAFCGWLCPVGTVSEWLWKFGRETFGRMWFAPRWLDIPLRSLKYLLLAFFLWFAGATSAASIEAFLSSPYGLVADVRMLAFFRQMSVTAAVVVGVLMAGSIIVPNLWCRYACPYGALMGLAAMASPLRIRRAPEACIDCAKCAKVCPSHLPVDRLVQIRSAECVGCMECVAACPAEGALYLGVSPLGGRFRVRPLALAGAIAAVFLFAVGAAMGTGHWNSGIPDRLYQGLIPMAQDLGHP